MINIDVYTTTVISSLQISLLNSAFNPIDSCPIEGGIFNPYEVTHLDGEATPDRYPLGDWENRFVCKTISVMNLVCMCFCHCFSFRYSSQLVRNPVNRLFDMPVYGANTSISSLSIR